MRDTVEADHRVVLLRRRVDRLPVGAHRHRYRAVEAVRARAQVRAGVVVVEAGCEEDHAGGVAVEADYGVVAERSHVDGVPLGAHGDRVRLAQPVDVGRTLVVVGVVVLGAVLERDRAGRRVAAEAHDRVVRARDGIQRGSVGADRKRLGFAQSRRLLSAVVAPGVVVVDAALRGQRAGRGIAVEADDRVVEQRGGVDRPAVGADRDGLRGLEPVHGRRAVVGRRDVVVLDAALGHQVSRPRRARPRRRRAPPRRMPSLRVPSDPSRPSVRQIGVRGGAYLRFFLVTFQRRSAGVGSALPAASTARTAKTYLVLRLSPLILSGEVQGSNDPLPGADVEAALERHARLAAAELELRPCASASSASGPCGFRCRAERCRRSGPSPERGARRRRCRGRRPGCAPRRPCPATRAASRRHRRPR